MKKVILGLVFLFLVPFISTHAMTASEEQQLIQTLLQQIASLQAQLQVLISQGATTVPSQSFNARQILDGDFSTATNFSVGDTVESTVDILNVRSSPGTGGVIAKISSGILGKLISGPKIVVNGSKWWQVSWNNGINGWSAESFISKTNGPIPVVTSIPPNSKYISIISPIPGEIIKQGTGYNVRWTGRETDVNSYDVYLYNGYSLVQTYLGSANLQTDKDVSAFYWAVPTNFTVGSGYQFHLVSGKNVSTNVTGGWSNAFTLADYNGNVGSTVTLTTDTDKIVKPGEAVLLRFSANNVSYCAGPDTLISRNIQNTINGFNTVYPKETTTYSIHCYKKTPTTEQENGHPDASARVVVNVSGQTSTTDPIVSVISPVAGSALETGKTYSVAWSLGNGTVNGGPYTVNLVGGSLGSVGSRYITSIPSSLPNSSGSFAWQVPNDIIASSGYQISFSGPRATGNNSGSFLIIGAKSPIPALTPTVSLSVNQSFGSGSDTAIAGTYKVLDWTETNATVCYLSSNSGMNQLVYNRGDNVTQTSSSGSQSVGPLNQTTAYTITCTGAGGSNSASVTINVGTVPTAGPAVSFSATPTSITAGQVTRLVWNASDATQCTGTPSGMFAGTNNSVETYQTQTTTYTLTCSNSAGQSVTQNVTVAVTPASPPAPTVRLSINSSYYLGASTLPAGSQTILDWSSTNATTCNAPWLASGYGAGPGSQTVGPIYQTTTYTLTCTGAGGSNSASVTINVLAPTTAVPSAPTGLTATAGACGTGVINLSWSAVPNIIYYDIHGGNNAFYGGMPLQISLPGSTLSYVDRGVTSASSGFTPGASYSYYITTRNSVGESSPSNTASAIAPSACPTNTNSTTGPNGVELMYNGQPNLASVQIGFDALLKAFQEYVSGVNRQD